MSNRVKTSFHGKIAKEVTSQHSDMEKLVMATDETATNSRSVLHKEELSQWLRFLERCDKCYITSSGMQSFLLAHCVKKSASC